MRQVQDQILVLVQNQQAVRIGHPVALGVTGEVVFRNGEDETRRKSSSGWSVRDPRAWCENPAVVVLTVFSCQLPVLLNGSSGARFGFGIYFKTFTATGSSRDVGMMLFGNGVVLSGFVKVPVPVLGS